jgi:hypothetical protein
VSLRSPVRRRACGAGRADALEADEPGPVALAVQHSDRALLHVAVFRHQAQGLFDAKSGTVKQYDQRTVADAGWGTV